MTELHVQADPERRRISVAVVDAEGSALAATVGPERLDELLDLLAPVVALGTPLRLLRDALSELHDAEPPPTGSKL